MRAQAKAQILGKSLYVWIRQDTTDAAFLFAERSSPYSIHITRLTKTCTEYKNIHARVHFNGPGATTTLGALGSQPAVLFLIRRIYVRSSRKREDTFNHDQVAIADGEIVGIYLAAGSFKIYNSMLTDETRRSQDVFKKQTTNSSPDQLPYSSTYVVYCQP